MLFAEFENVESQPALYHAVNAFVAKLLARLRGGHAHLPSAA